MAGYQLPVLEMVKFLESCSKVNFNVGQPFRDRVLVAVVGDEAVFRDPEPQVPCPEGWECRGPQAGASDESAPSVAALRVSRRWYCEPGR